MPQRVHRLWFATIAVIAFGAVSCSEKEPLPESETGSTQSAVIAVSVITLDNPFFVSLTDQLVAKGAERGYRVEIVSADYDHQTQGNQISAFIERAVDAIILCPADSRKVGESVRHANAAGIPVFTADIAVTDADAGVVCHVATDNFHGGELAAEAMVQALAGPGTVAIIDHPEVESANKRTRGFEKRLAELNAEGPYPVEIIAKRPGKGTAWQGYEAASEILDDHPDVVGIFAINDPSALGVIRALEERGRLNNGMVVVGFDGAAEAVEALQRGHIDADVVQHPQMIAWRVIDAISDHLAGREVEDEQLLRPTVIRAAALELETEPAEG